MPFNHGGFAPRFAAVAKRDDDCTRGGFYKTPTTGESVDSLKPLAVSWDTACIDATYLDLLVYWSDSNSTDRSVIQTFTNIKNADGTYSAELQPKFWGAAPSANLQLLLLEHGAQPYENTLPAGPVFTATYAAPSAGPIPAAADTSNINSTDSTINVSAALSSSHKVSGGKVAAAVLLPLIAIILGVLVWLKLSRKKQQSKRQAWNEKVDKRMSTISQDWKPISVAGATAAVRNSVYAPRSGSSAGSYNEKTGIPNVDPSTFPDPMPAHIRPNFRHINNAFENRVSRVSFAADPRPSTETRRSRKLMSTYSVTPQEPFHNHLPDPKLMRKDSTSSVSSDGDLASGTMSPRQTAGALSLSNDEIKRRISQRQSRASVRSGKTSFDSMLPALTLMRTISNENHELAYPAQTHVKPGEQYAAYNYQTAYAYASPVPPTPGAFASAPTLFDAGDEMQSPTPTRDQFPKSAPATEHNGAFTAEPESIFASSDLTPPASAPNHGSQFGGMQAMQAVPASFMSPDAMLKAYAARQNSLSSDSSSASTHSVPPSYATLPPSFKSTSLGKGVGIGGSGVGGISYPIASLQTTSQIHAGRNLVPAGPGAVSAARGAYGIME